MCKPLATTGTAFDATGHPSCCNFRCWAQSRRAEGKPECPLLGVMQTSQTSRHHRGDDNSDSVRTRTGDRQRTASRHCVITNARILRPDCGGLLSSDGPRQRDASPRPRFTKSASQRRATGSSIVRRIGAGQAARLHYWIATLVEQYFSERLQTSFVWVSQLDREVRCSGCNCLIACDHALGRGRAGAGLRAYC